MIEYDPGVQRERTALAWNRTGLAVLVNALIVLRAGAQANQLLIVGAGILLLASAAGAVVVSAWRTRRLARGTSVTTPWVLVLATVWIVWFTCIAAVAAIAATE